MSDCKNSFDAGKSANRFATPQSDDVFDDAQQDVIRRLAMPLDTQHINSDGHLQDAEMQFSRMSAESGTAAVSAVATELPQAGTAFTDMRDPMVSADGHRPTRGEIVRLGIGFTLVAVVCAIPWLAMTSVLLPQLLDGIDHDAKDAMIGTINSAGAVVALFANVIFGTLSDLTRSTFGRRTPWIIAGGVVTGVPIALIAVVREPWLIITLWCVAQLGYNMMLAPLVATMSDRVPDKFRGTISAVYGAGITIGQTLGSLVGAQLIDNPAAGFLIGGAIFALMGIITVGVWPREKSSVSMSREKFSFGMIMRSFTPPRNAPDFYYALFGRTLMMSGYFMITSYQLYIVRYYVFGGAENSTHSAAGTIAVMSIITLVVSLLAALISGPIADAIGKRKLPVALASCLFAAGAVVPWISPTVSAMYAFAAVAGFGYGVYNAIDQALNVAILPNPEEAGKDLGILNLANTMCTVLGAVLTSSIYVATQSYALVFPVCIVIVLVAAFLIMRIKGVE